MILREEAERLNKIIDEYKSKVKDLEFREEELNSIVNKMREGKCLDKEAADFQNQLQLSLNTSKKLQERVEQISQQFETLKDQKQTQFEKFDFHILELQKVIRDKDIQIDSLKDRPIMINDNTQPTDILSENNNTQIYHEILTKSRNKRRKKKSRTS